MGTDLVPIDVPTKTTTTTTEDNRFASSVVGLSTEGVAFELDEHDFGHDHGHFDDSHLLAQSSGPAFDANPAEAQDVVLYKGKSLATTIELDEGKDAESEGCFSPSMFLFELSDEREEENNGGKERTSGGESSTQASKNIVDPTLGFKSRSDLPSVHESKRRRTEALPAREELVNFTKTMDVSRPRKYDHKRYRFINPFAPDGVRDRGMFESKPRDFSNFLEVQIDVGKLAMHVLNQRARFSEDPIAPNAWERMYEKVKRVWEREHFERWGDRDFWPFHPGRTDGHVLPRIFAHRKSLESLEVVYWTDAGHEVVKPFLVPPIRSYPICFDPTVRICLWDHKDHTIRVVSPMDENDHSRRCLEDVGATVFNDFAKYQTDLHPVRAAFLDRHHNLGEVLACLFRFLFAFDIKFATDEGVLLRQDARLVWSQTSEAWANRFRAPTVIFRIGGFHYGWWHCRWHTTKQIRAEGTDRMYHIESDRWMGMFADGSDFVSYHHDQRWDSGRKK
jgi:hypothetical protein